MLLSAYHRSVSEGTKKEAARSDIKCDISTLKDEILSEIGAVCNISAEYFRKGTSVWSFFIIGASSLALVNTFGAIFLIGRYHDERFPASFAFLHGFPEHNRISCFSTFHIVTPALTPFFDATFFAIE